MGFKRKAFTRLPKIPLMLWYITQLIHVNFCIEGLEFGHLHYTALPGLQKMVTGMPKVSPKHDGINKGCALGKNTKKSFPRSKNRSKGILDLIHFDICGTMSSPSLSGCLYYVLFIDDNSRKSWIYFLKAKSETFDRFKEFKALIIKLDWQTHPYLEIT